MRELSIREPLKALLILISLCGAGKALAGDAAYPEAMGFSADGTRFAYAEWGQQDGSGFSYASVYVIDLERDVWLTKPVHEMLRSETSLPRSAFAKALAGAEPALSQAGITHPARLVFSNDFAFPTGDGSTHSVTYKPIALSEAGQMQHQISLVPFEISSNNCDEAALGFALNWDGREIYRDAKLSKSRGCPTGYSVERFYMPDAIFGAKYGVALIGVYRWGFEGSDLRHIAVPVPLQ